MVLIIASKFVFSQTDSIKNSDFSHYTDCRKYNNMKTVKGDTLRIDKSFMFDKKGNLIRKLKEYPWNDPLELTLYSYNNKNILLKETKYKTTNMENVFDSHRQIYFNNKSGLTDSIVMINSYPYFDYEITDSTLQTKNILEFDEPIWKPVSEDTSSSTHASITQIQDGKEVMIIGYKKVKKKVSLREISIDTATTCKFYYNDKNQIIKEFFGNNGWNISERTIIDYDSKGRISSVLCYTKNSYKIKDEAQMDSTNLWMRAYYTDGLKKEDALKRVTRLMKEQMSDTLLKYNSYFKYNKDGSVTETSTYSNEIYKFTSYRNKKSQIVKTVSSHAYVQNKYEHGRFIPTDITLLPISEFSFYEETALYYYDSLDRIIKITEKYIDNDNGESEKYRTSENFIIFKYESNLPLKLPEAEYVDYYPNYHRLYSEKITKTKG